jgi:hypothetical protein
MQNYQTCKASNYSTIFPPKRLLFTPVVGSQYGATAEAAESLIAQIKSQSKLATLRRKKRKIRYENEINKKRKY